MFNSLIKKILNRLPWLRGKMHTLLYSWMYKHLGRNLKIYKNCGIYHKENIWISDNVTISFGCFISPLDLHVGENSWLGNNNFICGNVTIGRNVAIGPNVIIPGANHDIKVNKDTSMGNTLKILGTVIEDDVWIGGNASILDGVTVGKGAVIGAGSVVTKNIPAFSIAVGNPAKVIGQR